MDNFRPVAHLQFYLSHHSNHKEPVKQHTQEVHLSLDLHTHMANHLSIELMLLQSFSEIHVPELGNFFFTI